MRVKSHVEDNPRYLVWRSLLSLVTIVVLGLLDPQLAEAMKYDKPQCRAIQQSKLKN
jgi:hypothetical protein